MSDDESKIPDRDTCQKLTENFAEITNTNEALAQTFLQDYEWDLQKSISAFYEALAKEEEHNKFKKITTERHESNQSTSQSSDIRGLPAPTGFFDNATVEKLFGEGKVVTSEPPPRMKFISWNLDGLDERNLKKRTRAVIKLIQEHEPDVVFFQEVILESCQYIESKLPEYKCIRGGEENYFTVTLLRIFTIFYDRHYIVDYPETSMGRNLLITEAHMGKFKLQLLNTHLESTAEHANTRMMQLKYAFDRCQSFNKDYTVIFGGDLNLRDKEAIIPPNFYDLWEFCGSPKEFKYTWDMTKNNNLEGFGRFKPRCRFDRIYYRFSEPKRAIPKHFALIGCQKVPNTQSFPSDHWGIVILFELNHSI